MLRGSEGNLESEFDLCGFRMVILETLHGSNEELAFLFAMATDVEVLLCSRFISIEMQKDEGQLNLQLAFNEIESGVIVV